MSNSGNNKMIIIKNNAQIARVKVETGAYGIWIDF